MSIFHGWNTFLNNIIKQEKNKKLKTFSMPGLSYDAQTIYYFKILITQNAYEMPR